MEKITMKLSKNLVIPVYICAILGVIGFFKGCSTSSQHSKMKKEIVTLQNKVDSMNVEHKKALGDIYTKEELDRRMEIEGLRTSKRTLYDWNAVIRTTVRPDDRMNEYDQQIKALENKSE